MQSAAKILAKKLKLDESAVSTYEGAPKATVGAIVLALAKDGKLPATEAPKQDGYTVTYTGGTVVYGARPRSLLFAAGEPEHWAAPKAAPYRRNPDFAIRTAQWHPDYPVAEQTAIFGANFYPRTCLLRRRSRRCPMSLGNSPRRSRRAWWQAPRRTRRRTPRG